MMQIVFNRRPRWPLILKQVSHGLLVLTLAGGLQGALAGPSSAGLGVLEGRLKPPLDTPNSVSSQTSLYPDHPQRQHADIAPFRYNGPSEAALQTLAGLLQKTPGVVLVAQTPAYLQAEARTRWLKFTDDLEFALNETEGVIHVRSASRLGYHDLGANRRRVEALRSAFQSLQN